MNRLAALAMVREPEESQAEAGHSRGKVCCSISEQIRVAAVCGFRLAPLGGTAEGGCLHIISGCSRRSAPPIYSPPMREAKSGAEVGWGARE